MVRNTLEKLSSGEYLKSSSTRVAIADKLSEIISRENKLTEKLSRINDSLFDIYRSQMLK